MYELVQKEYRAVVDSYLGTYAEARKLWALYLKTGRYVIRRRRGF